MTRPATLAAPLLLLPLLLPLPARAEMPEQAVPFAGPQGERRVSAQPVTPDVFRFADLPARGPSEHLPIQRRPNRKWLAYEEELQRLKTERPSLPAESFPHVTEDPTPAPAAGKGSLSPLAPTLGNGFEGITQGGFIPSEPTAAAGPLNVFTAGNVSVTVTNKDGTNRVETNGATFFGVPGSEGAISDAQCYYDAIRGRFIALCFTQGTSPNFSKFYLAISQTNDARGLWWRYSFDMTLDGATPTSNWGDYQGLGVSDDKIVFSSQQFSFSSNLYQYSKFRVIDRAAAYAGSPLTYVDFANYAPPPGGNSGDVFVTKPARNLTPGDNTIHALCVRTGGGTRVAYRTITGSPAAPVLSSGNLVSVASYSPPPDAAQLGSGTLVATNDCRPTDHYVRNGVFIATWHTAANFGGGTDESAIRLFRMRTSDRVVLTDELFGAANTYYYYPAVTVDSVGTIFLGFDRSSTTEYPSAYASGKRRSDASIQPSALLKAGVSHTNQSRWGDYTGIDLDASQTNPGQAVAWYAGQWTKGTNTFGTWINKLTYTYGQVFGTVSDDCDGSAATTGDRVALAGVTVNLMQGVTTVGTTTTNVLGQYNFGYLESGTYDVVVVAPPGGTNVDAVAGTGATSQTRVSASDVQVVLTNAQSSSGNQFAVAAVKPAPATASIAPSVRAAGDPQFSLTVNGSGFSTCSVVRLDGSDRATTYVSPTQLTAIITTTDQAAGATKTVTVFTPAPGGGTSNGQTLTILGTPDTQPPLVDVTSPDGGESWAAGSSQVITWTATDDIVVASVDLAFSTDGGATFPTAIATGIANSGSYNWTVPLAVTTQARVRVRAVDGSGNVGSDSSAADFAITGWVITATAGPNGTIAPSGAVSVANGSTPSFTMTPATGYHVLDVLVNGVSVGAVTSYQFAPVTADQTIAASFAINTYTLTLGTVGSGTVTPVPDQPAYDHGTIVQLTATPAGGWNFDFWTGGASGSANPLNLTMDANKSVTANFGQHVYTWNQTGTASWSTATNWTPTRTAPAVNDVLIFDNGAASAIVTNVQSQTVASIQVSGNTNVAFQASAPVTVTLAGGSPPNLSVAAGSTLQLSGSQAVTLALGSGATGRVDGATVLASGAHRLTATDPNALAYRAGSLCQTGVSFSGNPFGTTSLGSVEFQSGSLYQHIAGANPFGASAPSSVVTFLAGSRYRVDGPISPSMSGRTYADFEYNNATTVSATGGTAFTVDSLTVSQGTLNLNLTGGGFVRGDVHVKAGATLGLNPASGSPVFTFDGPGLQSVDVQGAFANTSNATVRLNNPAGVALVTDWTLNGPLSFLAGNLKTGARTLNLTATGAASGAGQGTGWVEGTLRKTYAAGAFSGSLDVGDAATYAPVVVAGSGAGAGFNLTARSDAGDHPSLAGSGIDPARSANRRWTLAPASAAGATWSATLHFAASDLDGGADPNTFLARVWNGSAWSSLAPGALTATSTQVTGLSSATPGTEFAVGNAPSFTITASAGAGGGIAPSGAVSVAPGADQTFDITPDAGFAIADVLVDAGSVGAVAQYTFTNVTADHTIAASFAGVARALTVNVVGGGSVSKTPDQPSYANGSSVQLEAFPAMGWAFSAWSGDLTGSTNPENLLMDADKTVTSTFLDVAPPLVAVTSPNGADVLTVGTNAALTWSASDNAAVTSVDLELSRAGAGGPYEPVASGLANSGAYNWTVTGPVTSNALLRATARDAASNSAQDVSDAVFSIADPTGVDGGPVTAVALAPVWPNPARGTLRFGFALPHEANVRLGVLDVQGRELLVPADGTFPAGRHSLDGRAGALDPGLYFVRLHALGRTLVRRFAYVK